MNSHVLSFSLRYQLKELQANAGSNIIGTTFQDLAGIIALVEDKSRVRVCLDTCHLFAAGYDLRTPEMYAQTMKEFNDVVGNGYLGGMHFNDSKMGLGEKKDLHENIGL
jgi:AP endonuclease-1